MTVKLSSSLPDADRNGLGLLQGELVRTPQARHVVIAVVDCVRTTVEHGDEGDTYIPTAGVLFIEPVRDAEDVETVMEVMGRLRAERVDGGTLDFDFGVTDPLDSLRSTVKRLNDDGVTIEFSKGPGS